MILLPSFVFPYLNPEKSSNNNLAASLPKGLFSNASAMQHCLSSVGRRKQEPVTTLGLFKSQNHWEACSISFLALRPSVERSCSR